MIYKQVFASSEFCLVQLPVCFRTISWHPDTSPTIKFWAYGVVLACSILHASQFLLPVQLNPNPASRAGHFPGVQIASSWLYPHGSGGNPGFYCCASFDLRLSVSKMKQQLRACHQAWPSEYDPRDPYGRGRELIPTSYPLTSLCRPWHMQICPYIYMYIHVNTLTK